MIAATDTLPKPPKHIEVSGHRIKFRLPQQLAWGLVVGAYFALIVAGFYFGVLQVHWYIHIGSFNHGFDLKKWWDGGMGFIRSTAWPLYRHNIRNLGEPAAAVMGVKTVMAAKKYWGVRVGTARVILTPPFLLVLALALIVCGTWLLDFGLPHLWHYANWPTYQGWHGVWTEMGKLSVADLVLGFGIGYILHHVWGPVGATLNGDALDRSVDKHTNARGKVTSVPFWVRHDVAAPTLRERWTWMASINKVITARKPIPRWIITTLIAVSLILVALGIIGHYVVGVFGVSVPYLAP